jgi:hypothetical protein
LPVYNINQSRIAWRASYSKRAWAFAVRAGNPGRRSASYSAKPSCFFFSFLRGMGSQFHAAILFIAFIVVFPDFEIQKQKARRSFRLSGLCGEFLADDAEVYSVVLPESSQSCTAARSMPCVKQDAGAFGRMDGRWMKVVFMSLGKLRTSFRWSNAAMQHRQRQPRPGNICELGL